MDKSFAELLKTEVNSAMVMFENHSSDNGFFESTIEKVEKKLLERCYEFIGISKHIPFESAATAYSVAFVYRFDGEIYWCHLPQVYWFNLLKQCYGWEEADKIVSSIFYSHE